MYIVYIFTIISIAQHLPVFMGSNLVKIEDTLSVSSLC